MPVRGELGAGERAGQEARATEARATSGRAAAAEPRGAKLQRHCDDGWDGSIDEVRISGTARAAGWIQTEYNNQSAPGVRGATVPVALTGTNFVAGTVAADNPGIAVSDVAVLSAT